MIWIPLLANLLAVLGVAGIRYREVGLRHAAPGPISPGIWGAAVAATALVLVWLVLRARRERPTGRQRMALAELLLAYLPLFLLVWGALPSEGLQLRHLPLVAGLVGLYAWLWWRGRLARGPLPARMARGRQALRRLLPATLGTVLVCAAVAIATRTVPSPTAVAISLGTYPLFAAVQLAIFAEVALPRLQALSPRRAPVVAVAAGLFALAHWPNGALMGLCAAAMLLWADTWLRARSLGALALCMGVAATACAQLLPPQFTHHMRTGPGYVLQAHRDELIRRERSLLTELAAAEFYRHRGGDAEAFVVGVSERILGRAPRPAELQAGLRTLELARREEVVRGFLASTEYRAREEISSGPVGGEEALVAELASDNWFGAQGGTWSGFVSALYAELLGRTPSPAELGGWPPAPDLTARTRLIWSYLDGDEWAANPAEPAHAVRHLGPLWMR